MATNVKPSDLNYNVHATKKYDDDIVCVIPGYEEMHQHIDVIIGEWMDRDIRILELGIGTGLTADRILNNLCKNPERYIGIDFSAQMLDGAKNRLAGYEHLLGYDSITLVNADYATFPFPEDNDLVISVVGIHHQETDNDKKRLFGKIFGSLKNNGAFIFGDLVTYRDPTEAAVNEELHYHHLVTHARDEVSLKEWEHHHKFLNKLAPLEDQVAWLREVGFRNMDVVYKKFNTALVYAKK